MPTNNNTHPTETLSHISTLYQGDGATVRIYAIGAHDVACQKAKSRK